MVRKKDAFWQHVEPIVEGRFRCNYCRRDFPGGIPRVKSHLSGIRGRDIDVCSKVPKDVQVAAREAINSAKRKQKAEASSDDVQISAIDATNGTNKRPKIESCSANFDDNFSKVHEKDTHKLDNLLAKFALLNDIDCSIIRSSSFIEFVNALVEFGCGYKLPSYAAVKTKLIPDLGEEVAAYVKNVKSSWERTGCTLISDIWCDDMEGICYINIMSQCPTGLVLLGTFEISKSELSASYLKEIVSFVIQNVGPERVVQFIHSGAPRVELLGLPKSNHVFVTNCAATEIQLLFEDIYTGIEWVQATVDRGNFVVDFMYKHCTIFALVRKYTNKKELKRPRMTEFSSNYEMLKAFVEVKGELLLLVKSSEWFSSDCDAEETRRQVAEIIENENFWSQVQEVLIALEPLFHALCLVNTDGSTFGYLYAAMEMAEETIERLYDNNPSRYQSLWDTFNSRKGRIVHPMHAAAAFLNPAYMCSDTFKHCHRIKDGMNFVLENLAAEEEEDAFLDEMNQYRMKPSEVFTYTAMKMLKISHPCEWWDYCGDHLPILRKYALRILSQPCSSSSCKRSLSAFEAAQVKLRRRSTPAMLENCLHIRLNAMVMARSNTRKALDRKPIDLKELGKLKSPEENSANGSPDEATVLCFNEQRTSRSSFTRNQLPESNYLQLHFITMVSSPLVTGQKVEGERGSPIHVFLVDPQTGFIVQDGALSKLELVVSVLEGDFNEEGETDWTREYFQSNEITTMIPLVAGNLQVVLHGGIGTLGDIAFNEDSSMARNGKFRLGVKTSSDGCEGFCIREGISNAFVVKAIEATASTNPVACDMLLPDDLNPPYNLQGSLSFPVTGDYYEIFDEGFLWSLDECRAEYSFKSKQAATKWFKLKAILQWAILGRILKRKRARKMVVKSRVKKRLDECSIGQSWNAKEDRLSPVPSPPQMFFYGNDEHEDDEKDVMEPINLSSGDTAPSELSFQMGQGLTIFPTLLMEHGNELKDEANEVLNPHVDPSVTPFKAREQKVALKRDKSCRATITDAGGSIPTKPDGNYFNHSMTLFPSLLTANNMEPTNDDLLEPNSGGYIELNKLALMVRLGSDGYSLGRDIQQAESSSWLTMLDDGVVRQCKYENDYHNTAQKQGYISSTSRAEKRWRKLKYILRLVLLWKVVAAKSFKEQCEGASPSHILNWRRSSSEQAVRCPRQVLGENDCSKSAHKQEDKHQDKSWQAARRWRELRAVLWFTLLRTMNTKSQVWLSAIAPGPRVGMFSAKGRLSTVSQVVHGSSRHKKDSRVTVMVKGCNYGDSVPDDGFIWRKYGQKDILAYPFPRSYYRCKDRNIYNCPAKKQVQRLDSDPSTFEVTYVGCHTCVMSAAVSPWLQLPEAEVANSPAKPTSWTEDIECDDNKHSPDQATVSISNPSNDVEASVS